MEERKDVIGPITSRKKDGICGEEAIVDLLTRWRRRERDVIGPVTSRKAVESFADLLTRQGEVAVGLLTRWEKGDEAIEGSRGSNPCLMPDSQRYLRFDMPVSRHPANSFLLPPS